MGKKIGEFLVEKGLITEDQLNVLLQEHQQSNVRLGDLVVAKGYVSQESMAQALAEYFNIPYIRLNEIYKDIPPEVISCIPKELAYRFKVIPVKRNNNTLQIAMSDPLEIANIDTLRISTGYRIENAMALQSDILDAIEYCYHSAPIMREHIESFIDLELQSGAAGMKQEALEAGVDDPPVVMYVKSLIIQAINNKVSDILLQPKDDIADLRFRIDGILVDQEPPPLEMFSAISSRIKILSGLNIAENRKPQDGRFRIKVSNRDVDIRVSTFPTIHGESIVMRVLNAASVLLSLNELGFEDEELRKYQRIINKGYGLILVTGPTGSGKTTTLYSSLNAIKSKEKHIVTMEDPVEYRLKFVTQSQVNSKIGYNFADGMRSILRQSPDIILVGEIRDKETADISIHASLTGHLVFSTLHTNDTSSAAIRLINMGVEPYLISSSLLGVLAQRLIRVICPDCREPANVDPATLKENFPEETIGEVYCGKGCEKCNGTGYKGRMAIYELLIPNEEILQLILKRRSGEEVKKAAMKTGMTTLRKNAIKKLKEGRTTVEEVFRLTQETEDA